MQSGGQVDINRVSFNGHVANHLIVGEDTVSVQLTIVSHTATAKGHLSENMEIKGCSRGMSQSCGAKTVILVTTSFCLGSNPGLSLVKQTEN